MLGRLTEPLWRKVTSRGKQNAQLFLKGSAGLALEQGRWLAGFPGGASGKESVCQSKRRRRQDSVPGLGRSPRGGYCNPLWCSCLENPKDRGAWWATAHRVKEPGTTEAA